MGIARTGEYTARRSAFSYPVAPVNRGEGQGEGRLSKFGTCPSPCPSPHEYIGRGENRNDEIRMTNDETNPKSPAPTQTIDIPSIHSSFVISHSSLSAKDYLLLVAFCSLLF